MGTFGEIAEPSSRTAWEDWDELVCNENQCCPELHLEKAAVPPKPIDTFFLLEGRYLYDYIKDQSELECVNSIPEVNLHLYRAKNGNNYMCAIKDYNLIQSSEIVELLRSYISLSTDVIAVLTKPLVEYQVLKPVTSEYVIRSICASKEIMRPHNINYPHLEQPNIISGVSAGVLTLREITDSPALAVVLYLEHQDDQVIPELQDLLQTYKITSHVTKGNRSTLFSSNLYI